MRLDDILKTESLNGTCINLYLYNGFFEAYETSCFFLETQIWPGIAIMLKYIPDRQITDILRAGFPKASLDKVIKAAEPKHRVVWPKELSPAQLDQAKRCDQPIVITGFAAEAGAFVHWREKHLSQIERAKKLLLPPHAKMKVAKESFDLGNLILTTVRKFSKELQLTLGDRLLDHVVTIDELFYAYVDCQSAGDKLEIIARLEREYARLAFLLQLGFEQKAHSLQRHLAFATSLDKIRSQLSLMRASIERKLALAKRSSDVE